MSRLRHFALALPLALLTGAAGAGAQGTARRLTTIDALRQFPGYFHLQNVVLRGEFGESGAAIVLRAETGEIRVRLADKVTTSTGPVEIRGQLIDVGRLEPDDPRASDHLQGRERDRWPRPGEELIVQVGAVTDAVTATSPSVRALALEPWKFSGRQITLTGNFRGRNLFGDLPGAPAKSRYDFVMRGTEGAVWVTGLRPRGRGFDLDVDRRVDTDRWLEVTGTVVHERGLVRIEAERMTLAKAPATGERAPAPDPAAQAPLVPAEVVFSAPSDGETGVSAASPVRIQFSKGLDEKLVQAGIRASYLGAARQPGAPAGPPFKAVYDGANRAVIITFTPPLEPFRTVRIETLDALKGFDGSPVTPWTLTFSVGS